MSLLRDAAKDACSAWVLLLLARILPASAGSSRAALHHLVPNEARAHLSPKAKEHPQPARKPLRGGGDSPRVRQEQQGRAGTGVQPPPREDKVGGSGDCPGLTPLKELRSFPSFPQPRLGGKGSRVPLPPFPRNLLQVIS